MEIACIFRKTCKDWLIKMLLKTKNLTCQYQNGNLRYVKNGDVEIVRMVYSAVRDGLWLTAKMSVFDEKIEQKDNCFEIKYRAQYRLNDIDYQAFIRILGQEDDTISFHFEGEAQSDFLRNRIGLCVHHPIRECAGKPVFIENTEGCVSQSAFPKHISPHQPFLNIQKIRWHTEGGIEATLIFEGDIFETEDQRNWTDGSFKTYSTPLSIPFPVAVKKGDKVGQSVVLKVKNAALKTPAKIQNLESEIKLPFPKIGFARSDAPLTKTEIALLKQVPFDHYRVECFFEKNWKKTLRTAFKEAKTLETNIELVVLLNDNFEQYWLDLKGVLEKTNVVKSILWVGEKGQVPPQSACPVGRYSLNIFIPKVKNAFQDIKIGVGTDAFFAELNRNRPTDTRLDFIAFSLNPQVHLTDNEALIENLAVQKHTIDTAHSFFKKGVHVTPVTLKWRYHPNAADSVDARQHTPFIADWTALSLKYLAAAASLTFYETKGEKGLLNPEGDSPVFDFFKKVKAFQPIFIIQNEVEDPLKNDCLILENGVGEQLIFNISFI